MRLLIANWKMQIGSQAEAVKLAKASDGANVIVCPSFMWLPAVCKVLKKAKTGAQDMFWEEAGAYTGETSGAQLLALGVSHVILGHSERRALGETDEVVAKKVAAALEQRITPIICIGESAADRDGGRTREVIDRQLRGALSLIPADFGNSQPLVYIAYEPVWAISSHHLSPGGSATPEDVAGVIHYMQGIIRGVPITPQFLYGGSVDEKTLGGFLARPEIKGALVGAASTRPAEFKKMIALAKATEETMH